MTFAPTIRLLLSLLTTISRRMVAIRFLEVSSLREVAQEGAVMVARDVRAVQVDREEVPHSIYKQVPRPVHKVQLLERKPTEIREELITVAATTQVRVAGERVLSRLLTTTPMEG
jgi:hypothetical protein